MSNNKKKKNPKRLECLKKKIKELSILCDVEALFLCKEDDPSSNSFDSWPQDRNTCLSSIDKYKRSSVPAKSYNKKTNAVPLSSVLGKRKERNYAHMEFWENSQENKKLHMGLFDGVDFDDFYGKFFQSVQETQAVLCDNVKENEKFELGFFDGVEFDENCLSFCESIQPNKYLRKSVQESKKFEMELCQNVQEIKNFQMGFDEFYGKFCESVEENTDLYQNMQKVEGFQKGFFDGLDSDQICGNFCGSISENRDLSYTQMLLCEEMEGFQMGFVDGRDYDEFSGNFFESIQENREKFHVSEKLEMTNVDGFINKLGREDVIEILKWIDCAFTYL